MSRSPRPGAPGLDASPWEPECRFLDGREGFTDSRSLRAATQASSYGMQSRAGIGATSGLTRRGAVYEHVRAHPGAHVRGIAKDLRLANGDLQYHLFWLEKHGFVKTKRSGFYRLVYPTMVFQEAQEVLLGVLCQRTPREILLCILHDPNVTQGDIARSLGLSQPTVSWHMERLFQKGLIAKEGTSRGTFYKVIADRDEVMSFVRTYHKEVWKRWSGRLELVLAVGGKRASKGGPLQRARLMPPPVVEPFGSG
jgi:DNA-binding MarR family transcriptional regulator